jgi:hypothetical protein
MESHTLFTHSLFRICSLLICLVLLVSAVSAATTEVHVVKTAADGSTVLAERTVDYQWLESNLPVLGDGVTHYYLQGPVFDGDVWDPTESVNVEEKDMGALKGTDLRDICDLVGGMQSDDTLVVKASDGFSKRFSYNTIYSPPAREGPLVLTWYRGDEGHVPSYSNGMRIVFFADTSVNPWGYHVFGLSDMKASMPSNEWNFFDIYPTTTGLSARYVNELRIISTQQAPTTTETTTSATPTPTPTATPSVTQTEQPTVVVTTINTTPTSTNTATPSVTQTEQPTVVVTTINTTPTSTTTVTPSVTQTQTPTATATTLTIIPTVSVTETTRETTVPTATPTTVGTTEQVSPTTVATTPLITAIRTIDTGVTTRSTPVVTASTTPVISSPSTTSPVPSISLSVTNTLVPSHEQTVVPAPDITSNGIQSSTTSTSAGTVAPGAGTIAPVVTATSRSSVQTASSSGGAPVSTGDSSSDSSSDDYTGVGGMNTTTATTAITTVTTPQTPAGNATPTPTQVNTSTPVMTTPTPPFLDTGSQDEYSPLTIPGGSNSKSSSGGQTSTKNFLSTIQSTIDRLSSSDLSILLLIAAALLFILLIFAGLIIIVLLLLLALVGILYLRQRREKELNDQQNRE